MIQGQFRHFHLRKTFIETACEVGVRNFRVQFAVYLIISFFNSSHKQTKSGFMPGIGNHFEDESAELLLGVCKIPLIGLLACHTGMMSLILLRLQ